MKITPTALEGVVVLEPNVFPDERGYFFESFSQRAFGEKVCGTVFVQDNESGSSYGVVRGLHYQLPPSAQAKLVRVVRGEILDVAVDVRLGSPTFGRHVAVRLSGDNKRQLFIPHGFAHGFSVLSAEGAVVQYKCDGYYDPSREASVAFDDPSLGIDWLVPAEKIIVSEKDRRNPLLKDAVLYDAENPLLR